MKVKIYDIEIEGNVIEVLIVIESLLSIGREIEKEVEK